MQGCGRAIRYVSTGQRRAAYAMPVQRIVTRGPALVRGARRNQMQSPPAPVQRVPAARFSPLISPCSTKAAARLGHGEIKCETAPPRYTWYQNGGVLHLIWRFWH
eukprot:2888601-Rhodomonas_salina.2